MILYQLTINVAKKMNNFGLQLESITSNAKSIEQPWRTHRPTKKGNALNINTQSGWDFSTEFYRMVCSRNSAIYNAPRELGAPVALGCSSHINGDLGINLKLAANSSHSPPISGNCPPYH